MSSTLTTSTVDGPIHSYFELTYSTHLVLPRVLLQSMPEEWQEQFTALLERFDRAFAHVETPEYEVNACEWVAAEDLTDAQMRDLGVTYDPTEMGLYYDRHGNEVDAVHRFAVPADDPLPHYRHGYVQPHGA